MSGPLAGVRIVELAGIGPGPYTCMLLADAGAEVIRIDRATGSPAAADGPHWDLLNRSRRSVAVDLKHPEGVALVLDLVAQADGLVEGWRPGVAERLGIGPEPCLARNRRLVFGRMTGWGQHGPLASAAGHDINYIALAGALWPIGRRRGASRSSAEPRRGLRRGRDGPGLRDVARPCSRRNVRGTARSSTPPWWTERPRS